MNKKIKQNFIYPKIDHKTRTFGSTLSSPVLNIDGDWRSYLPPVEDQKRRGVESSACFIEAQQHAIATILEFKYSIIDSNYSARFNALLSDGTEWGGDPIVGIDSMRKDGLVKEESMPFNEDITSWEDYHSWKGVNKEEVLKEGKEFADKWKINYRITVEKDMPLEVKYANIKRDLRYSSVCVSVYGEVDANGNYIPKPELASDTHFTECVYVDDQNRIHLRDTYAPYDKMLPANYNPDFGMSYIVTKLSSKKKESWFRFLLNLIKKLIWG